MTAGLGVDVGGTFTDVVWWDGNRLRAAKTSSTADQSEGVAAGSRSVLRSGRAGVMVHGTTVATNALLERAGAVTALVTDRGFESLIEIGRQARPSLYDPFADPAPPVVPRELRLGWDPSSHESLVAALAEGGVETVAVSLLRSYENGADEVRVERALGGRWPVSLSHRVVAEFREYERASTTTVNAYLGPTVAAYLENLERVVVPALADRILVVRSSGGTVPPSVAGRLAASILLSGPAGGVVAAAGLGSRLGHGRVISFDMGGTSTDVCRIENAQPEVSFERSIDGLVVRMPSVAVHTVGAGGGSIGWLDSGGALRVGPRSAGAAPGPASYGRGGRDPTVTDANVALGRIGPGLAGAVTIDRAAAVAALARLGGSAVDVARGMVAVVESTMERAIRAVSVEEGADPRDAVLMAFGGAGGLHATALARRLEMKSVVIPPLAGVFSALGLLMAPARRDAARSVLVGAEGVARLDRVVDELVEATSAGLRADAGTGPERVDASVDVRYVGQSHETTVAFRSGEGWDALASRFHRAHHERNGFSRPDDPIEAVTARAAAVGRAVLSWADLPDQRPGGDLLRGTRDVHGESRAVPVLWRPAMHPGQEVAGPAVVEDAEATTWLGAGERAVLHPMGALEVTW
jgi:N-methylhydantoinase A